MTTFAPDPRWEAGPRVRLDSLRPGQRFMDYTGNVFVIDRYGWPPDCPHVRHDDGSDGPLFAGCAEGVPLPPRTDTRTPGTDTGADRQVALRY